MSIKQKIGLGVIALIVIIAIIYFVSRRSKGGASGCFKKRANFGSYSSIGVEWGKIGFKSDELFGDWNTSTDNYKYIDGFLKGIDVYPSVESVEYYQNDIRKYMSNPAKIGAEYVVKGSFLCENGGEIPSA